jgi:hypothetical protein
MAYQDDAGTTCSYPCHRREYKPVLDYGDFLVDEHSQLFT